VQLGHEEKQLIPNAFGERSGSRQFAGGSDAFGQRR
jgi:hypothetical protein